MTDEQTQRMIENLPAPLGMHDRMPGGSTPEEWPVPYFDVIGSWSVGDDVCITVASIGGGTITRLGVRGYPADAFAWERSGVDAHVLLRGMGEWFPVWYADGHAPRDA